MLQSDCESGMADNASEVNLSKVELLRMSAGGGGIPEGRGIQLKTLHVRDRELVRTPSEKYQIYLRFCWKAQRRFCSRSPGRNVLMDFLQDSKFQKLLVKRVESSEGSPWSIGREGGPWLRTAI